LGVAPVGSHPVGGMGCRRGRWSWGRGHGCDGSDGRRAVSVGTGRETGGLLLLRFLALHRSGWQTRDGNSVVSDLDSVAALAFSGGAQVAETDGLFDGQLPRCSDNTEPCGELVDGNQRDDRSWEAVHAVVGGDPHGVGPDDEEAGSGSHWKLNMVVTGHGMRVRVHWLLFWPSENRASKNRASKRERKRPL
jgi:hypothetical protein